MTMILHLLFVLCGKSEYTDLTVERNKTNQHKFVYFSLSSNWNCGGNACGVELVDV